MYIYSSYGTVQYPLHIYASIHTHSIVHRVRTKGVIIGGFLIREGSSATWVALPGMFFPHSFSHSFLPWKQLSTGHHVFVERLPRVWEDIKMIHSIDSTPWQISSRSQHTIVCTQLKLTNCPSIESQHPPAISGRMPAIECCLWVT